MVFLHSGAHQIERQRCPELLEEGSQAATAVVFPSMLPPAKTMLYSQHRDTDSAALLLKELVLV